MTLDIEKLFKNVIEKQSKINHFDCKIKVVKTDKVPASIKDLITNQYGKKYLDDADYISFFWGNITKENIGKLFKVVDSALGGSANKMTETDFKIINMDSDENTSEDTSDNTGDEDTSSKEDNTTSDTENTEDAKDNSEASDSESKDLDLDKEIDDVINEEDEGSEGEDPSETEPAVDNKFFLKITIK